MIERLGDELQPTTGRWMRTAEAAAYLGLTRSALYSRISDVPHYKVDRLLLFKREDLDQWLARHRREPRQADDWNDETTALPNTRRARPRSPRADLLPVGPKSRPPKAKPKRERTLPPPLGGDEKQKDRWAWQLEISRAELDEMDPRDFELAWDARNERLREGGVFDRIGELADKLGTQAMDEMQPSALIRAAKELGPT